MAISGLLKEVDQIADYTMGAVSALVVGATGGVIQAGLRVREWVPEGARQGAQRGLAVSRVINEYGPIITPIATLALGFSILSDEPENDLANAIIAVATVALANKVIDYPKFTSCLEAVGELVGAVKTSIYAIGKGFYEGSRDSLPIGFRVGRSIYSMAALPGQMIGGLVDNLISTKDRPSEENASRLYTSLGKIVSFSAAVGYSYVKIADLIEQLAFAEG